MENAKSLPFLKLSQSVLSSSDCSFEFRLGLFSGLASINREIFYCKIKFSIFYRNRLNRPKKTISPAEHKDLDRQERVAAKYDQIPRMCSDAIVYAEFLYWKSEMNTVLNLIVLIYKSKPIGQSGFFS